MSPDRRASRFRRSGGARPLVLGHRGAAHGAPENTFRAFELARREGADGVELDVRLDGSGEAVVIHDRTLARVSSQRSSARVDALATAELCAVDVGAGERVPLLVDVLDWAARHDLCVNVELKSEHASRVRLVPAVLECLRRAGARTERVLLSSFDPLAVAALARGQSEYAVAWLIHDEQRVFKWGYGRRLLGASGLNPQHTLLTAGRLRRWRRGSGLVATWTVNDTARARECAALGVDALISDRPGEILAALG